MEETISLSELFNILKKRIVSILFCALLGFIVSSIVTFFVITPKYSSEAQLIVTIPQKENQGNVNEVNANLMMLNTYKDLIKGEAVLKDVQKNVMKEMDFKGTTDQLRQIITVEQSQNSQMFSIKATTINPYTAQTIANTTAKVFMQKVKDILTVDKISLISSAPLKLTPVSPNKQLNLAIGLVLGLMIGIGLAFLIEFLDKTVKDETFLTEELGLTLLGVIPEISEKELFSKEEERRKKTSKTKKRKKRGERQ